jgi:lipid-binding SYLF domain-containing protein
MRTIVLMCALAAVGGLFLSGCSTAPKSEAKRTNLETEAQAAIQVAKTADPGMQKFFDTAAGYAVFPSIGKAAWVVGGAYGKGMLYEHGQPVGYCDMTQASVGLAWGGQAFTEIIFFETTEALNKFKAGQLALAAQASAVAVTAGASANANYSNGVLVFTRGEKGLMVEASVGGQKFTYQPLGAVPPTASSPGTASTSSSAGTATVTTPTSATTRTPQ